MSDENVAVIGLGKIGLSMAVQYAKKGKIVVGVDINEEITNKINLGIEPFPGEKNLGIYLEEVIAKGKLSATTSYQNALESCDVIVITTPLFIDKFNFPDFQILDSVARSIGKFIRRETLVILETTVPVGTTRNRLASTIEFESSLKAGVDFSIAFSPERVLTGRIFEDLKSYPKLVGGIDEKSCIRARAFYESVLEFNERIDLNRNNGVWVMQSVESAELAKLAETTYRDVNIALANEFAKFAKSQNIEFNEIIEAANSQPFSHIHSPGIWVGGHCIPVYPHLYLDGHPDAKIVRQARITNSDILNTCLMEMQEFVRDWCSETVLILGVSYRPGVKEAYLSGAREIVNKLENLGAKTKVHDPLYEDSELRDLGLVPLESKSEITIAVLLTAHNEYLEMRPSDFSNLKLLYDGRAFLNRDNWSPVKYLSI